MIEITKLPAWGKDNNGEKADAPKNIRFPYAPEFNNRICFADVGDALKLKCDAIVVATTESLDATDCIHEDIVKACGPEFRKDTKALAPLKITEPRIVAVPGERIGAKNVITVMPPRYSDKYRSAAINSLNKTILNSLQASVDNGYRTIVFTAIHDLEHKYDPKIASDVVARTIRRFFEHQLDKVDMICLCLEGRIKEYYTNDMKLYFPRSAEEATEAEKSLPKDVGNEWGEIVVENRSIRISALPGMGGDDDDDYSDGDDDQVPEKVSDNHDAMEFSQKQPSPDARSTQGVDDPSSPNYIPPGYVSGILNRATQLDLSPLEKARFFYDCGMDTLSNRNILVFIGKNLVQPSVPREHVMPYMAHVMDSVSFNAFTIVYLHCPATNNSDSMFWIHSIAATFPRRCLCNMRLAVVYPTFWLKTHLRINRLVDLRPVEDISYYDNLGALFRVIGRDSVRLPEDVARSDISANLSSHTSDSSKRTQATAAAASEDDNL